MSEQPPRASGHVPFPGEAELQREELEIDPETPAAARESATRDAAAREAVSGDPAVRDPAVREPAPRDATPLDAATRGMPPHGDSFTSGAPRNPYGFPDVDGERAGGADAEERVRTRASEGLDRAADALRRLGHQARDQGGLAGRAEPIAYQVGDSLQSAASYVRAHDLYDMREDVEDRVHRSPLKALALAAVGGFLLGRLIR